MDRITFDIETVANEKLLKKKLPLGGVKDRKKYMATDPWMNNIVSIGVLEVKGTTKSLFYFGPPDYNTELEKLNAFWNLARDHNVFVTFNGCGFDVPTLEMASARNGIEVPVHIPTSKYSAADGRNGIYHFDLQTFAAEGRKQGHRLETLAAIFDIPGKKGDGSQVAGLVAKKQWTRLKDYQLADVQLTDDVFERLYHPKTNIEMLCEEFYRDSEGTVRFAKSVKWGSDTIRKDSRVLEYPGYLEWLSNRAERKSPDVVKVAKELMQR